MRWTLLVLTLACGGKAEDTGAETCALSTGSISGLVWDWNVEGDPVPLAGAAIYVAAGGERVLELRSDAEGRYSLELEAGTYGLSAEELSSGCLTSEVLQVDVEACGAVEADLNMDIWPG
jgi:hypothetical protein